MPRYLLEVWTTAVLANGTITETRNHGEVSSGGDCGGSGRSESTVLYERDCKSRAGTDCPVRRALDTQKSTPDSTLDR